jgi:hypothetical protein
MHIGLVRMNEGDIRDQGWNQADDLAGKGIFDDFRA